MRQTARGKNRFLSVASRPVAGLVLFIVLLGAPGPARTEPVDDARTIVERVRQRSFPELAGTDVRIGSIRSQDYFFRARFALREYLFSPHMRYIIDVSSQPWTQNAPARGIEAIVAHELSHVVYYKSGPRIRLIGLIRLMSVGFTARFERQTDAVAIARGFGPGLIEYRTWLYQQLTPAVAAKKKQIYMTPDEIQRALGSKLVSNQP